MTIELSDISDLTVPAWIDSEVLCDSDRVRAILQGGCSSGAYMPAVTYHIALSTMNEHGDDVFQCIEDGFGELLTPLEATSWGAMAVFYLSVAVELWCSNASQAIDDAEGCDDE